jgi:hypothetical protein
MGLVPLVGVAVNQGPPEDVLVVTTTVAGLSDDKVLVWFGGGGAPTTVVNDILEGLMLSKDDEGRATGDNSARNMSSRPPFWL